MKVTFEFDLEECTECPLRKNMYGHGENYDYCCHPYAPKGYGGYGNIIGDASLDKNGFPIWCPFKQNK